MWKIPKAFTEKHRKKAEHLENNRINAKIFIDFTGKKRVLWKKILNIPLVLLDKSIEIGYNNIMFYHALLFLHTESVGGRNI